MAGIHYEIYAVVEAKGNRFIMPRQAAVHGFAHYILDIRD
jgi:hypothetical protein